MQRTAVPCRILAAAAGLGTALLLAACGTSATGASGAAAPATASQATAEAVSSFNQDDVMFARMMIPDHKMVADMAELAQEKAGDESLKSLAAEMKQGQDQAVEMLGGMLTAWGESAGSDAGMKMPGAMDEEDMAKLESLEGMEFDMTFAQMMIEHHEQSIKMAEDEQAKGRNAEAKAMAAEMIEEQRAQVTELKKIAEM